MTAPEPPTIQIVSKTADVAVRDAFPLNRGPFARFFASPEGPRHRAEMGVLRFDEPDGIDFLPVQPGWLVDRLLLEALLIAMEDNPAGRMLTVWSVPNPTDFLITGASMEPSPVDVLRVAGTRSVWRTFWQWPAEYGADHAFSKKVFHASIPRLSIAPDPSASSPAHDILSAIVGVTTLPGYSCDLASVQGWIKSLDPSMSIVTVEPWGLRLGTNPENPTVLLPAKSSAEGSVGKYPVLNFCAYGETPEETAAVPIEKRCWAFAMNMSVLNVVPFADMRQAMGAVH